MPRIPCALVLAATLAAAGCASPGSVAPALAEEEARVRGLPAHSPVHGDAARLGSATLLFDARLGAYVVAEMQDHYYVGGRFYRHGPRGWQSSPALGGPWRRPAPERVPSGLRSRYTSRR